MTVQLRYYQQEAIEAIYKHWENGGQNPLVDAATGTGKSLLLSALIKGAIDQYQNVRVMVLTHVKELVKQDFLALMKFWPNAPMGIHCAGLNKKDVNNKIIFGSIHSVGNKAKLFGPRDLIIIDEAHMIPHKAGGTYRKYIEAAKELQPYCKIVGLTATPYRLSTGRLDEGDDKIFDKIVYTYGIGQGIKDGWLTPLTTPASKNDIELVQINTIGVRKVAGDYNQKQLAERASQVTEKAIKQVAAIAKSDNRKKWLVYCTGINHANETAEIIRSYGFRCKAITSLTSSSDRETYLRQLENGQLDSVTNADTLTTGLDINAIDLIVQLRKTLSTSLYVQICGRGTRVVWPSGFNPNTATAKERRSAIANGPKANCLVLDFAGNIRLHGPVDSIDVESKSKKRSGEAPVKKCPSCQEIVHISAPECPNCDFAFPEPEEKPIHESSADGESVILSTDKVPPRALPVVAWSQHIHKKNGSPDSVRIVYTAGIAQYPEWLAFEYGGGASLRAASWWAQHNGQFPTPKTSQEAINRWGEIQPPKTITVQKNGKYFNIIGRSFHQKEEVA